jgi:hypothetical protein
MKEKISFDMESAIQALRDGKDPCGKGGNWCFVILVIRDIFIPVLKKIRMMRDIWLTVFIVYPGILFQSGLSMDAVLLAVLFAVLGRRRKTATPQYLTTEN